MNTIHNKSVYQISSINLRQKRNEEVRKPKVDKKVSCLVKQKRGKNVKGRLQYTCLEYSR